MSYLSEYCEKLILKKIPTSLYSKKIDNTTTFSFKFNTPDPNIKICIDIGYNVDNIYLITYWISHINSTVFACSFNGDIGVCGNNLGFIYEILYNKSENEIIDKLNLILDKKEY